MHKLSNIRFNADKRDYAHLQIKRMLAAEYDYDTDIKPFENRRCRYEARAQINRRRIFDTLRINLCAATK